MRVLDSGGGADGVRDDMSRCRCYINAKYYARQASKGGNMKGYIPCPVHEVENKLLSEDTRHLIIEKMIEQNIKDAKEHDGIETMAHCDRFNGIKGYTNYTDKELLETCVFWLFGIDIEWTMVKK